MYDVILNGVLRQAEFTVDMEKKKITRTYLRVEDGAEDEACDVIYVTIKDRDSESNLEVVWIVLCGKKEDIIEAIEDELPVAKLEADAIFDAFKMDEYESEICYTYPLKKNLTKVIQRSPTYKVLESTQQSIVASTLEVPADKVRVLDPVNS